MPFEYALLRAVPRVDRGECINVGVIVYCQAHDFLGGRVHLDADRLRTLDRDVDVEAVSAALAGVVAVCDGEESGGRAGEQRAGQRSAGQPQAGQLRTRERFGWLTAPRSTVVQPGPVHSGLTDDPGTELDRLLDALVR